MEVVVWLRVVGETKIGTFRERLLCVCGEGGDMW